MLGGVFVKDTSTLESVGMSKGLADKDKGFQEVMTKALTSGETIGPPADKE